MSRARRFWDNALEWTLCLEVADLIGGILDAIVDIF